MTFDLKANCNNLINKNEGLQLLKVKRENFELQRPILETNRYVTSTNRLVVTNCQQAMSAVR